MAIVINGQTGIDAGHLPISNAGNTEIEGTLTGADVTVASITANSVVTQGQNVSPFSGFKNYIINGDFRVNQYGRLPLTSTGTSGVCIDNWRYANTGTGTLTVSIDTITYGGRVYKALKGTTTAAMQDASVIYAHYTNIEDKSCFNLRNKPFTISFLCEVNYAGNYSLNIRKVNDDGNITTSYVKLVSLAAGVNKVEVNVPADANYISDNSISGRGLNICFGINGVNSTTEGWQSGNFVSHASTFKWWGIVGAYIKITNFQLEEGSVATPFEQRPYGLELSMCQRYYEQERDYYINSAAFSSSDSVLLSTTTMFKVEKRITPTVIVYDLGGNAGRVHRQTTISSGGADVAASVTATTKGFCTISSDASNVAGKHIFKFTASAEL